MNRARGARVIVRLLLIGVFITGHCERTLARKHRFYIYRERRRGTGARLAYLPDGVKARAHRAVSERAVGAAAERTIRIPRASAASGSSANRPRRILRNRGGDITAGRGRNDALPRG